jgi:hypothetical protein
MGRSNGIVFGKITLTSEVDTMSKLVEQLGVVLQKYGYPAEGSVKTVVEDDAKVLDKLEADLLVGEEEA